MAIKLESLLESAGVDVELAKKALNELDDAFAGEPGDIPDGALSMWVNAHFTGKERAFFMALGKAWEKEIELPEGRKWEKGPHAAEVKAKMNLKKAEAKK